MTLLDDLVGWLVTRDPDEMETLLRLRDDVLWGAPPVDLDDLAERLVHPSSVARSMSALPEPAIQVVEVLAACGSGASLERAAELLDPASSEDTRHRAEVERWVAALTVAGLVWPARGRQGGGERLTLNPGVLEVISAPLGLGRPAAAVLAEVSASELARVTRRWGLEVPKRKAELVAAVGALLADGPLVRELVAGAPEPVRRVLEDLAAGAAHRTPHGGGDLPPHLESAAAFAAYRVASQWAVENGLAFGQTYGAGLEIPAEVHLALLDGRIRAPFDPANPLIPTAPVASAQVTSSAAGAAMAFLSVTMAVLELLARSPAAQVRSGGIGARELTRLAKVLGAEVAEVRLGLECAGLLGLLMADARGVSTAERFATWRRLAPPERAAELLRSWVDMAFAPTVDRDDEGKAVAALARTTASGRDSSARHSMLTWLRQLGEGVGAAGVRPVVAAVAWRLPMLVGEHAEILVRAAWDEAERLGVIAHGRLTSLGVAVLSGADGDGGELVAELTRMLPEVQRSVRIGSDHTVVVSGTPDVAVVDLLDAVAVREARGPASVWRLTPSSVRDALDAGYVAQDLLHGLSELAGGTVPQAVEYLLSDVDRRYGQLGVRPAQAVIVSDDQALLAEVAADRRLRTLRMSVVAPAVLLAGRAPDAVLAALRTAGYLPVEQDADGARVVELRAIPRGLSSTGDGGPGDAGSGDAGQDDADPDGSGDDDAREDEGGPVPAGDDTAEAALRRWAQEAALAEVAVRDLPELVDEPVEEVALRLLRGGAPDTADAVARLEQDIRSETTRLTGPEVRQLAHAVAHGLPVQIRYRASSGGVTVRVVSDLRLHNGHLWGWCHLREDDRYFLVSSILGVAAVA